MNFTARFGLFAAPVALVASAAIAQPANDLARVEASIAATSTMTADFVQTDSKRRSSAGKIALKRPGRVLFAYNAVNAKLVADGKSLHYLDYDVGQHNKWGIGNSPLSVLLSAKPDLKRIARIGPSENANVVVVRARDARRPEFGTMVLAFSRNGAAPGGLKLEGWTTIDAQNRKTVVRLSNQRFNVPVADSSFAFAPVKKKA
jgi:outer membrane lipoprotein-sorting protein